MAGMEDYQREFLEMRIRHLEDIFGPLDEVVDGVEKENDFENLSIARGLVDKTEEEYHMARRALEEDDYSIFGNWSYNNFAKMCHERGEDPEEVLEQWREERIEKWKKKKLD